MLKSEVGDVLDGCVDFRGWWTLVHQDQWISFGFSKEWIGWLSQDLVGFFGGLDRLVFSVVWIGWFFVDRVDFLRIGFFEIKLNG